MTELRRQSFLVGENEPNHTAQKQMLAILESNQPPVLEDLTKVFSIENLTDEFFTEYRDLTHKLEDDLKRIKETIPNVAKTFDENLIKEDVFAKKANGTNRFFILCSKKRVVGGSKKSRMGRWSKRFH